MAGYLIDSHIFLWAAQEPAELTDAERTLISDPANEVAVSTATFWELSIKTAIGRLPLLGPQQPVPGGYFATCAGQMGFTVIPVSAPEAELVRQLPQIHRDPFDRLLIAQAIITGRILITRDRVFSRYPGLQIFAG